MQEPNFEVELTWCHGVRWPGWYCVAWYGHGTVWLGMAWSWYSVAWYGHGTVWHGMVMVQCGMAWSWYSVAWYGMVTVQCDMVMVQCGMASLVSLAGLGVKTAQRRSVPILMLISQLSSHRHTAQKIQIQTRSNIPYLALYEPVQ